MFIKGIGTRKYFILIEKYWEFNNPLVFLLIDYTKTFDCVKWGIPSNVLSNIRTQTHIVYLLQSLHYRSTSELLEKSLKLEKY